MSEADDKLRELARAALADAAEPIQAEHIWDVYIAAANPAAILAILDERDALRAKLADAASYCRDLANHIDAGIAAKPSGG